MREAKDLIPDLHKVEKWGLARFLPFEKVPVPI